MTKEYAARRLDVKGFAQEGGTLGGREPMRQHARLMAETQGRGGDTPVAWSASAEIRNPLHVQPEIWLHLHADTLLPLTCQRCLAPVDVKVDVQRSFRFVANEERAAAEDDASQEDVLALSRNFDLVELVEDELLMELPLAPRHAVCPEPVQLSVGDQELAAVPAAREHPFALLGKLKLGGRSGKS